MGFPGHSKYAYMPVSGHQMVGVILEYPVYESFRAWQVSILVVMDGWGDTTQKKELNMEKETRFNPCCDGWLG